MPASVRRDPFSGSRTFRREAKSCQHIRERTPTGEYAYPPDITPFTAYRSPGKSANRGDLGVICDGGKMARRYFFELSGYPMVEIGIWWRSAFAGAIPLSCPLRQARSMSYSTRFRCFGAAVLLAFILAAPSVGQSQAEEIRLDALKIPVVISGSSGPASVALEAIVVRPDDRLPHPLAVLNHGSPRTAGNRPTLRLRGAAGSL